MKIVVCVKRTPAAGQVKIDPASGVAHAGAEAWGLNPFDEYAIEEAVRLKERLPGATTVALSAGPSEADAVLREALSRGVDEAVLVSAPPDADVWSVARFLAAAVNKIEAGAGPVLVLCGKQSNDGQSGLVPPALAAFLGRPNALSVRKIEEISAERAVVHRMAEDGSDVLEVQLPAVFGVLKEINEPRLPSLKGKMAAKKASIPRWTAADLGLPDAQSPTRVLRAAEPPPRPAGSRIEGGSVEEKAARLADKLQEMKLL